MANQFMDLVYSLNTIMAEKKLIPECLLHNGYNTVVLLRTVVVVVVVIVVQSFYYVLLCTDQFTTCTSFLGRGGGNLTDHNVTGLANFTLSLIYNVITCEFATS